MPSSVLGRVPGTILGFLLRFLVIGLAFLVVSTPPTPPARSAVPPVTGQSTEQEAPRFVPGTLLLKIDPAFRAQCFEDRIEIPSLQPLFAELQVQSAQKNFPQAEPVDGQVNEWGQELVDISLIYALRLPPSADIEAASDLLAAHPAVVYAEPRFIYEIQYTPNDQFLNYQWYLDTLQAELAWDHEKGDTNIVIGIIDTGTSFAHPDLVDQVALNPNDPIDGIDNDNDGYTDNYRGWDFGGSSYWAPQDNDPSFVGSAPGMDHGVLVTGVANAEPDNGIGLAGAGFNTHFLPLKAAVDQSISISFGMEAIVYGADHGVDILNLSWGSGSYSQAAEDIMAYAAVNKGVLLVAAAGNRHQNTFVYPSSYPHVMSVAATQPQDNVWDNGNGTGTSYNYLVDITAPGATMMTTAGPDTYWGGATGTSMSAPLVCAGAALVRAHYPQLNNIQAGEMVRVTAKDIYPYNGSYLEDRLGLGRLDLLKALTTPYAKSVRVDSLMLRDDDNDIIEPLDTMDVYTRLLNYLAPLQGLSIEISTPDTHLVEIIQNTVNIGPMASMASTYNSAPFKLYFKKDVEVRTRVFLKFQFTDGSSYSDYQYFPITINPLNVDLDENLLHTSINGLGNIGFSDNPDNTIGLGMTYDNSDNYMLDAGLVIGISQSKVVDNIRGSTSFRTHRFALKGQARRTVPGPKADLEATAHFDDSQGGSNEIGLDVRQHCYQYNDVDHDDYILVEYKISNKNNYPVNDIYAGMSTQWSSNYFIIDDANYYPQGNMIAAEMGGIQSSFSAGVSLVTNQNVNAYISSIPAYTASDQDKFVALTHPATQNSPRSGDVIEYISAGPFNLGPGDTATVAFALLAAPDLNQLAGVSATAYDKYWCELRNQTPTADLGPDLVICDGDPQPILDPGFQADLDYIWSTGDTNPTIAPSSSGTYAVTVVNGHGCSEEDEINVEFRSLAGVGIALPGSPLNEDSPIAFSINNPGPSTTFDWDFGDNNTALNNTGPVHVYSDPGTYTVTLTVSDGLCSYSTDTTIVVEAIVGLSEAGQLGFTAYPNPFHEQVKLRLENAWSGTVEIALWDLSGKKILHRELEKSPSLLQLELPMDDLPQGIYLATARHGIHRVSLRLQKR